MSGAEADNPLHLNASRSLMEELDFFSSKRIVKVVSIQIPYSPTAITDFLLSYHDL